MTPALAEKPVLTREDYLEMEAAAEYKSEYYGGEVFAMTGGTIHHSQIIANLIRRVGETLDETDCRLFESNMKLEVASENAFMYPDVMVVCGPVVPAGNTTHAITNPMVIIEVLSPSTESFDRGKKFTYYQTVKSLREYILVSQEEPQVETFFRQDASHWLYTVAKGLDAVIPIQSLERELKLSDIYLKVDWDQGF
ncbi:MAG: Uma2 family endonuclease [Desulfatirhabdiaceae bacterium]